MKAGGLIVMALAAVLAAPAPGADPDMLSALRACKAMTDATARLACFDRLTAQYDTAAPMAQSAVPRPPASVAQAAPPAFGGEDLKRDDDTPRPEESMTASVAKASFNAIGHFTIVLDNGQIWRQLDADTSKARFRDADSVKITKGFLDSYSLVIEGRWGIYKVKRIK